MKAIIKPTPTLFLKAVLVLLGAVAFAICASMLYAFVDSADAMRVPAQIFYIVVLAIVGVGATIVPFLFALLQAFKLLRYIDRQNAFSEASIHALKKIKYSAIVMTACYSLAMPAVYVFAELDDAPGVILVGLTIACAPLVVATFAAVLQKLVESAADMKAEQDLTV